jgi:uncharacterized protein YoxC
MNLKDLFDKGENGVLTYDQFKQFASEAKAKFVDLSEGGYVSKDKYTDDLMAKDNQIATLNADIQKRDTDLTELNTKLTNAGNDVEKLNQVSADLTTLQAKYQTDIANYQAQLQKQAYEFAVKDFANSKNFTSNAAKRDFINSMVGKQLTMSDGKIMGAEDFVNEYTQNNADAFVVETPSQPAQPSEPKPQFVTTTPGLQQPNAESNLFHFNFVGVRSHPEENKK